MLRGMSASRISAQVADAVVGLLVGAAAGFLLTGAAGAFSSFVLGRPLRADGTGAARAALIAVPAVCAALGAAVAARRAGRGPHRQNRG
jgi:hypothetical protein